MIICLFKIIILYLCTEKIEILCASLFPQEFYVASEKEPANPIFITFEGKRAILVNTDIYYFDSYLNGTYHLQQDNSNFFQNVKLNRNFDNIIPQLLDDGTYTYLVPSTESGAMINYKENNAFVHKFFEIYRMSEKSIISTNIIQNKFASLSYVSNGDKTGSAVIYTFSLTTKKMDFVYSVKETFPLSGLFKCHYDEKEDYLLCIYGTGTKEIKYLTYTFKQEVEKLQLATLTPDLSVMAVQSDINPSSKGIGIAYVNPNGEIWGFNFVHDNRNKRVYQEGDLVNTHIRADGFLGMKVFYLFENYYMISAFDGVKTNCYFFGSGFEHLNINGNNICGYQEFSAYHIDDKLLFLYRQEGTKIIYYNEYPLVQCKSKKYSISSTMPIVITMYELFYPELESIKEGSGIKLIIEDEYYPGGKFYEVDSDKEIEFNSNENFYFLLKYIAEETGEFTIKFGLYFTLISGESYVPTNICQITLQNTCYKTCETCSQMGSKSNNYCLTCQEKAKLLEGTENCYYTAPNGYYLDIDTLSYKPCSENCHSCTSLSTCVMCKNRYSLLSMYTLKEIDAVCVKACELETSRWNFINGEFQCLQNQCYCPIDQPCYNSERKQCMKMDDNSDCQMEIPKGLSQEKIQEYLDHNILDYYASRFIESYEGSTYTVYDSFFPSNEYFSYTNLTEIDLGECGDILREQYNLEKNESLIIAQIDSLMEDSAVSKVNISFYTKRGVKMNLTYCDNKMYTIKSPIINENKLSASSNEIMAFIRRKIDLFNPNNNFFNDKCEPYSKTKGGSDRDVPLRDRRSFFYQNIPLCGNDCDYIGISTSVLKASCLCHFNKNSSLVFEKRKKLSFQKTITNFNAEIVKCINLVFSKAGFENNFGSYILLSIIVAQIIIFILYLINKNSIANHFIYNSQGKLMSTLNDDKSISKTDNSKESFKIIDQNILEKKGLKLLKNNPDFQKTLQKNIVIYQNQNYSLKKSMIKNNSENFIETLNNKPSSRNNTLTARSDSQLDKLELYPAIQNDNRTFACLSLIRMKQYHPIYIFFFNNSNIINKFILLSHFIFGLTANLFFNAFFYSESYISKVYNDGYNFGHEIPKYFFSFLAAFFVCILLKKLILTFPDDETISLMKKSIGVNIIKRQIIYVTERMNLIYYGIMFLITIFFWYFVDSFFAVYQNSQANWLLGSLFSFCIYLLIPLIIALLSAGIRRLGITQKSELLYYLSRFIESY